MGSHFVNSFSLQKQILHVKQEFISLWNLLACMKIWTHKGCMVIEGKQSSRWQRLYTHAMGRRSTSFPPDLTWSVPPGSKLQRRKTLGPGVRDGDGIHIACVYPEDQDTSLASRRIFSTQGSYRLFRDGKEFIPLTVNATVNVEQLPELCLVPRVPRMWE